MQKYSKKPEYGAVQTWIWIFYWEVSLPSDGCWGEGLTNFSEWRLPCKVRELIPLGPDPHNHHKPTEDISILTAQQIHRASCKNQTHEILWSKFCQFDEFWFGKFGKFEVES